MSLKAFHVAFIALAMLLAGYLGWWSLVRWQHLGDGTWLALAAGSGATVAALAVYGVWFLKKTRGVSFL